MKQIAPMPLWVRSSRAVISRLPAGRYRMMHSVVAVMNRFGFARVPFVAEHRRLDGVRFICHLRDSIAREVCFTGGYEPVETELVRRLLRPGDSFADVGANWGYFTLLASKLVGAAGCVLSIEPDPRLFKLLADNLHLSACTNVQARSVAAADRHATLALCGFEESGGNWGLSRLVAAEPGAADFAVCAEPLDELLAGAGMHDVRLLKLDVEGAEDCALRGLSGALADNIVQFVLIELHPTSLAQRGISVRDVLQPMIRAGYQGWRIDHSHTTTRRAAYGAVAQPAALLSPVDAGCHEPADPWPHQLWVSRRIENPDTIFRGDQ